MEYFLSKISHFDESPEVNKTVDQQLLVVADNYTSAETRVSKFVADEKLKNCTIKEIKKQNISKSFDHKGELMDDEIFYKCRVHSFMPRENNSPKKITSYYLIEATDIKNASDSLVTELEKFEDLTYAITKIETTEISRVIKTL